MLLRVVECWSWSGETGYRLDRSQNTWWLTINILWAIESLSLNRTSLISGSKLNYCKPTRVRGNYACSTVSNQTRCLFTWRQWFCWDLPQTGLLSLGWQPCTRCTLHPAQLHPCDSSAFPFMLPFIKTSQEIPLYFLLLQITCIEITFLVWLLIKLHVCFIC